MASVSQIFLACASSVAPLDRPSPGRDCTPPPPDPRARLILERTPCFGECPAFTVECHPDGMVLYGGIRHVRVEGPREWTIRPAAAAALFSFPNMPKPMPPQSLCALEDDVYVTTGIAAYVECHGEDLVAGRCHMNNGP